MPNRSHFNLEFERQVEQFIEHFDTSHYDKCITDKAMCDILNQKITKEEIFSSVSKLKAGKSPGMDRIPVDFIKEVIKVIIDDLVILFNYIFVKQEYPKTWCDGLRIAIPKGKDDFRPITIESIFPKIFETIMDNRLTFINDAFQKVDQFNGGFLKDSMTQDNILILTTCIQKQLTLGKPLYIAYIDFQKAFNYVNHNILFYKLIKSGLSGQFVNLLRSMYKKLGAFIKINNKLYDYANDECGTSQGGPLSPNLFRYMLADLRSYLCNDHGIALDDVVISHLLWADDLVILSVTSGPSRTIKRFTNIL